MVIMTFMHVGNLQLSQLRLVHEIAVSGSLTDAAERVDLTQPAASHALARLRRQLNDPLFVRTSNGMRPTPYGARLAAAVREALVPLDAALDSHAEFSAKTSRRIFTLYISDNGQLVILPKLLTRLKELAPNISIRVRALPPKGLHVSLESGEVDLAIGSFTGLIAGFKQKRLFRESYLCVVRRDHPAFRNGLSVEGFRSAPHALVEGAGLAHELLDRWLNRHEIQRQVKLTVPHSMVLPMVIASSDLLAIMPSRVAAQFARMLPLKMLQPPLKLPMYDIKLFWHERFHADSANRWLRGVFVDLFNDLPAVHTASDAT
jgi:DNA-binding transcriptional LysR family regulator